MSDGIERVCGKLINFATEHVLNSARMQIKAWKIVMENCGKDDAVSAAVRLAAQEILDAANEVPVLETETPEPEEVKLN